MRCIAWAMGLLVVGLTGQVPAATTFDLATARLRLDDHGVMAQVELADGTRWPGSGGPVFVLETDGGTLLPVAVQEADGAVQVTFEGGTTAAFAVTHDRGCLAFRLTRFAPRGPVQRFRLFRLGTPADAQIGSVLNAAYGQQWTVAVLAAEPNVQALVEDAGGYRGDRAGCTHEFLPVGEAKVGSRAAQFTATANEQPGGWSIRGKNFPKPLDLTGCRAIRAWVHGDGQGEHLKIQLYDGAGGYRDNYLPIDFVGWRQVTLTDCPINTLRYGRVTTLNFYYNSLPAQQTVCCRLDQVEALVDRAGTEQVVVLEDFESAGSPLWTPAARTLNVQTATPHGLEPAAFGVLIAPRGEFLATVERFQRLAGLPSPRPGGVWNKTSPWVKRSYFFLTDFRESQFEEALAIARRGGFHMILLGQESWSHGTGHYEVNRDRFPDGLDGLRRTLGRFQAAGFRVGLHFLGPSVYPPDPYLTPVPDPRLVKGATTTLAAEIDEKTDFLPTPAAPAEFPAEDGGYEGAGTVLQIDDELGWYSERSLAAPFGFTQCRRGHLGTQAVAHRAGARIVHLVRSYGYHMFDMDTTLVDEVAGHFAQVANACGIDMIYFDGSERLQGDHWYYNARLHKTFYDHLQNKDMLLQASSFSPYSWHLMARSASADGHGDLKGYLDERSPWFDALARDGMPLDIGWYYGYDPNATLDEYEYILGATIGYDSSMSFQVSCAAAARHPFTGDILDLIARYEKLRLAGRVPAEMRTRLRIDPALGGQQTPDERARRCDRRREYRLLGPEGGEVFQRVVYQPWHDVRSLDGPDSVWTLDVKDGPVRVGVQIHAQGGAWLAPGPAYEAADALVLETFDDLAPYSPDPKNRRDVRQIGPGEAGAVSPGVTQQLALSDADARAGGRCAVYTATSTQPGLGGWSAIGRAFEPPLDLSWHRGIGFWLRGDGRGGQFKLQLRDGRGATDYYIANDYTGWRYQQLARPAEDPIDYRQVSSLTLYYNGLPGKTTVACAIDDVKALRTLDTQSITDPYVEIDGKRLPFGGTLTAGQYLLAWPGEPVTRYGLPLKDPQRAAEQAEDLVLPAGRYPVRFGLPTAPRLPVRVRLTLQPPERHPVP